MHIYLQLFLNILMINVQSFVMQFLNGTRNSV